LHPSSFSCGIFRCVCQDEIDPALAKIEADRKKATPMPEAIRKKLAELRKPIDLFQ